MTVHMGADSFDSAMGNVRVADRAKELTFFKDSRGRTALRWDDKAISLLRDLAAAKYNDREVGELMGVRQSVVAAARIRFSIPAGRKLAKREGPPPEFEQVAESLCIEEARHRFRAGREVIRSWYAMFGLKPRVRIYPNGSTVGNRTPKPKRKPVKPFALFGPRPGATPARDDSLVGRAVAHLQRRGPVFRARTIDRLAPIDVWVVNGRRLPEADMIALAERHGFERTMTL